MGKQTEATISMDKAKALYTRYCRRCADQGEQPQSFSDWCKLYNQLTGKKVVKE